MIAKRRGDPAPFMSSLHSAAACTSMRCVYTVRVPKSLPRPSDGELEIMRVLWAYDGSTAREIHKRIAAKRACQRTTVLRQLQAMLEKGLVRRNDDQFPQRYHAAAGEAETTGRLLNDFVQRVFGGSASRLVMHLLATKKPSAEEMRLIRQRLRKPRT
jgi:BlaI family penicillinase repressor